MAGRIKARKHAQRESYPACADLYRNNPRVLNSDLANPDAFSKDMAGHGFRLCTMPKGSPFKWGVYGEAPKIPLGLSGKTDAESAAPAAPSGADTEPGAEKKSDLGWLYMSASALVFAGVNIFLAIKILKLRAKTKAARAETEKKLAEMGKGELPPLAEPPLPLEDARPTPVPEPTLETATPPAPQLEPASAPQPEPLSEPEPQLQPEPQPKPLPLPLPLPLPVEPEPILLLEKPQAPLEDLPVLEVPELPKVSVPKHGAAKAERPSSAPQPLPRPAFVPIPPDSAGVSDMFDASKLLGEQSALVDLGKLMEAEAATTPTVVPEPQSQPEPVVLPESAVVSAPAVQEPDPAAVARGRELLERMEFEDRVPQVPEKKKGLFERMKDGVNSAIAKVRALLPGSTADDSMIVEQRTVGAPPSLPGAAKLPPRPQAPKLPTEVSDLIASSVERIEGLLPKAMRSSFVKSIWTYAVPTLKSKTYVSETIEGERMRWNFEKGEKAPTMVVVGNSISSVDDYRHYRQAWGRGALYNVMRSLIQVAKMADDEREKYLDNSGYMLGSAADRVIVENSALPMYARLALRMRSIDEFSKMKGEKLFTVAERLYTQWSMMTLASKKNVMEADQESRMPLDKTRSGRSDDMKPKNGSESLDLPPDSWIKSEAQFLEVEQKAWEKAAPKKSAEDAKIHATHTALFRNEWFESAKSAERFRIAKALAPVLFDAEFRSHRVQLLPDKQATQQLFKAGVYVGYKGNLTRDGLLLAFDRAGLDVPPVNTHITLPGNRNEILPLPKAPVDAPAPRDSKPAVDIDAAIAEVQAELARRYGGRMPIADVEELDLNEIEIIRDASEPSIRLDVSEMEEVRAASEASIRLDVSEMEEIRSASEASIQLKLSDMVEIPPTLGEGAEGGEIAVETKGSKHSYSKGGVTKAGAKEGVVHDRPGSRPLTDAEKLKAKAAKAGAKVEEARKK